MAKTNKSTDTSEQSANAGEAPAKRKRSVKPKHALVIEKQAELEEARKLSKVYDLIPKLGEWALRQIQSAAQVRLDEVLAAKHTTTQS